MGLCEQGGRGDHQGSRTNPFWRGSRFEIQWQFKDEQEILRYRLKPEVQLRGLSEITKWEISADGVEGQQSRWRFWTLKDQQCGLKLKVKFFRSEEKYFLLTALPAPGQGNKVCVLGQRERKREGWGEAGCLAPSFKEQNPGYWMAVDWEID